MINVIVSGSCGQMGNVLVELIQADPKFNIVAGVSKDISEKDYPLYQNILDVKENANVVIDFSRPDSLSSNLEYCTKKRIPLVIATTGYTNDELSNIEKASEIIPIFHSSNMSIGVNLVLKLVDIATHALSNFDIEILEKHHNKKVDAPSGTALMIANEIKDALNGDCEFNFARHGKDAKRSEKEIGIHALRGGTIVGEHTITYAGNDEIVEINHIALSKKIFAQGSLKAAEFILNKENGYYNMKNMIQI